MSGKHVNNQRIYYLQQYYVHVTVFFHGAIISLQIRNMIIA